MKNQITIENGPRNNLGWTVGTVTWNGIIYDFNVKHFDEPSQYGIKGGRISKLWLRRQGDVEPRLNYDRGWERGRGPYSNGPVVTPIYEALIAKFN